MVKTQHCYDGNILVLRLCYIKDLQKKVGLELIFETSFMKRKIIGLDPIHGMTKSEASYEKLMLEMMSKLVSETRENNNLIRQHFGKPSNKASLNATTSNFKSGLPMRVTPQKFAASDISPKKNESRVEDVYESTSGKNLKNKTMKQSSSGSNLREEQQQPIGVFEEHYDPKMEKILESLEVRLRAGQDVNKKLLEKIEKMDINKDGDKRFKEKVSMKNINQASGKEEEIALIQKALADKFVRNNEEENIYKKSSYILPEILPYSDRREIKVKFKISEIIKLAQQYKIDEFKAETSEWLGQVYRATASICWNMLLNNSLSFDEVKVLFTQNIIFNFVDYMKALGKISKEKLLQQITSTINKKSVSILDFLCRQYPQTKIEAPNLALRSILPQIDNQGRSKYDLVCKSGISFRYREDGDYTAQIMRMVNFMIERGNEEFQGFVSYMRQTFEEIYLPIDKRRRQENNYEKVEIEMKQDDYLYRDKVKSYTKYLIGRKIPKNTSLYTEEQIEDGVFFVKSNAVLRIVTKWVQQLKEYFENPDKRIKYNYNQNKDHDGNIMYLSALLKNGIYDQILKSKDQLFEKINKIRMECQKMEYLLSHEDYTTDPSQLHLSQEQICVGMYACNIKSVISSYICSELNELIHFLLKIPRNVSEDSLGNDLEVFQAQARKELDAVNLITFKLSDLLRCKIHSNEEEIIWLVKYLIHQSQHNRDKFKIVRIKDRLGMGTRDIMINGQINRGLTCEIQLAVTSTSDKKQQLLDSYNHFLYELKRSQLGSIIENVSIWSNLEQRYLYFEQILKKKKKKLYILRKNPLNHKCGPSSIKSFKRPLICQECKKFFPIPKTCLLNVLCKNCGTTFCGQCYYYNYLDEEERKKFIFDGHRLLKQDVMNKLVEYTDYTRPLPATGFFIKKDFLTKELSFYMAIQKNKQENVKDAPHIQILVIQTIIRNEEIFNRQVNRKEIYARLEKGQFFIKDYEKTELNSYLIFYFQNPEAKKKMTLKDLQAELQKEENGKSKVLSILDEPSYIPTLNLLKKETDKKKQLQYLKEVVKDGKIIVFAFRHFYLLAQVLVKGSALRAQIRKRVNMGQLKQFAQRDSDIVSMQYKHMTTELCDIAIKWKPKLYDSFCQNLRKLFLSNGTIESIQCFSNFVNLETVFINENKLTNLKGIENLKFLMAFRFDSNEIDSLEYFANNTSMRYISANCNKISSLKGLEKLTELRSLSIYENQLTSLQQLKNHQHLDQLYLRANPLTDLSVVQTIPKLNKLFIGKTPCKSLPDLSSLKNLRSLSLQNLNLDAIPPIFSKLSLNDLSLSNNNIKQMTNLNNQTQLLTLNLSNNQISQIKDVDSMDKLQVLKIHHNQIKVVKGIGHLESLKYLSLKNNPIDDIGELYSFEINFKYSITQETLTDKAKKQLAELQISKNSLSSSED